MITEFNIKNLTNGCSIVAIIKCVASSYGKRCFEIGTLYPIIRQEYTQFPFKIIDDDFNVSISYCSYSTIEEAFDMLKNDKHYTFEIVEVYEPYKKDYLSKIYEVDLI